MRTSFNPSVLAIMEEIKQQTVVSEAMPHSARKQNHGQQQGQQHGRQGAQGNVGQAAQAAGDAMVNVAQNVQQQGQIDDPTSPDQQTVDKMNRQPQKPQQTPQQQANRHNVKKQLAQQHDKNRDGQLDQMESVENYVTAYLIEHIGDEDRAKQVMEAISSGYQDGIFGYQAAKNILAKRLPESVHEGVDDIVTFLTKRKITKGLGVMIEEGKDDPVITGDDDAFNEPEEHNDDNEGETANKAKNHIKTLKSQAPKAPKAERHNTELKDGGSDTDDKHQTLDKSVLCHEGVLNTDDREKLIDSIFKD